MASKPQDVTYSGFAFIWNVRLSLLKGLDTNGNSGFSNCFLFLLDLEVLLLFFPLGAGVSDLSIRVLAGRPVC